jgi:hypothetical protein
MKKLLFLLVMWPVSAHAQMYGCFVRDGETECATGRMGLQDCYDVQESPKAYLGEPIADLCNTTIVYAEAYERRKEGWAKCSEGWQKTVGDWNYYSNIDAQTISNQAKTIKKRDSLVSRLRKACGNRCKAIK